MESLYQTYLTGLLSAKAGLKYWEEEHQRNPTDITAAQIKKLLAIIEEYETKLANLVEKMKQNQTIFDWFNWIGMIFDLAKEVMKLWSKR